MTSHGRGRNPRARISAATAFQVIVRLGAVLSGAVVASALARSLQPVRFGEFSLLISLVSIVSNVGDFGITQVAIKRLASNPASEQQTLAGLLAAKSIVGMAGGTLVVSLPYLVGRPYPPLLASVMVGVTMFMAPLSCFRVLGQARLKLAGVNALLVSQSALWTAAVLIVAATMPSLDAFAVAFMVYSGAQALLTFITFRPSFKISMRGWLATTRSLLFQSWPLGLGGLCVTVYYKIDGLIVYHYAGAVASGQYAAAYRFLDVLQVVPATVVGVLLPVLSRQNSTIQRRKTLHFSLVAVMALAVPAAVGGALLAPEIVRLVYGQEFSGSIPLLRILMAAFPAISIGYVGSTIAIVGERTRSMAVIAGAAAVMNLIVNIALIPTFRAAAAAWSTVGTELFVAGGLIWLAWRARDVDLPLVALSKLIGAGLVEVGTIAATGMLGLLPRILFGSTAYILVCMAFRVVPTSELERMFGIRLSLRSAR